MHKRTIKTKQILLLLAFLITGETAVAQQKVKDGSVTGTVFHKQTVKHTTHRSKS